MWNLRRSLKPASLAIVVLIILQMIDVGNCARGGGGRRGGRKGTKYGMRMPILIKSRNPEAGNYYDHKDVSFSKTFFFKKFIVEQTLGSFLECVVNSYFF